MSNLALPIIGGIFLVTVTLFTILVIGHKNEVLPQTIILFFIQLTLALVFFYRFGLFEDAKLYSTFGKNISETWSKGFFFKFDGFFKRNQIPLSIIGAFYTIFGQYPLLPILLNCFIFSMTPALIASACRNFGLVDSAKTAAWFMIFFPSITLNVPWLRKEAQVFFLISALILAMSFMYKNQITKGLILGISLLYAFSIIRSQFIIVCLIGLWFSYFLNPKVTNIYRSFSIELRRKIIASIMFFSMLILIPILLFVIRIQGFRDSTALDNLIKYNSSPNQSTSIAGASLEGNSNLIMFIYNMFRSLWGPPIWEWRNLSMTIFGLEGFLILVFSFFVAMSYYLNYYHRRVFLILLATTLPLVIYSTVMLANYGLNSRLRAHIVIFTIPIAASFFGERSSQRLEAKSKN
jgi:hypothetical protein